MWEELQLRNGALLEWLEAGVDSLVQANKRSGGGVKVFSEPAAQSKRSQAAVVESEEEEEEDMGSDYDEEDDDMGMDQEGEDDDEDEGKDMGIAARTVKADKQREADTSGRSAPKRRGPASQYVGFGVWWRGAKLCSSVCVCVCMCVRVCGYNEFLYV